ncbi:hypothetical protein Bca101_043998 [Brassica carinata]
MRSIKNGSYLHVKHGDGFKGLDQPTLSTTVTILPPPERIRQEIPRGAVGLGDDGGESAISEERVGGTTDTVWIAVGGLIGEGTPLGGLVHGVRLQDQAALVGEGTPLGGLCNPSVAGCLRETTDLVGER